MSNGDTTERDPTRRDSRECEQAGSRRGSEQSERTRREYVKYGGAVIGGGFLAGCSANTESDSTTTEPSTETATESRTASPTETDTSYEACIEPTGCLTFEEVPETWMAITGPWADMAIALGQRDGFKPGGFYPPSYFFEQVGIKMPTGFPPLLLSNGWDKERFYELDPDVILCDPKYLHSVGFGGSWKKSDTQELIDNVAPFFGNNIVRRREFHDYKLYSLYEAFDRLANLFQERERFEAFAAIHEEMQVTIQSGLPVENERPEVGLVNAGSSPNEGNFYAMTTQGEGVEMKTYRDLDVRSVFTEEMTNGTIGYETLLDLDPEILIVHSGVAQTDENGEFSSTAFHNRFIAPMEANSVGRQLTAVQEGNIYPGVYFMQGPIVNLFQTELTARQLYPDEFGTFDLENWPDVPEDEQLFDHQRIVDIINGEF